MAELVGADPTAVVFSSGGTESNAQAIVSALAAGCERLIVGATEHPCVAEAATASGAPVEVLPVDVNGVVDLAWLAEALTDFGFDHPLYTFAREGFAPFRDEYKAACVNLGRHVTFDLPGGGTGSGTAIDVDADGQLIVRTDSGEEKVFTGEVSVHGIYGAV